MHRLIQALPKAELHVHLEGTLEPDHIISLAARNNVTLPYATPADVLAAYDFHDLPSFLKLYYAGMAVLKTEQDFYDLAYAYFEKAAAENIVYVEPFFDPQGHTSRGVAFETVINGIYRAQLDAASMLGLKSNLIMCFLRDMSAESAMEHLEMSLPFRGKIIGVGLDSDEKGNPPSKFAAVFAKARKMGYKLTMHCDVNQDNSTQHIHQCLHMIDVDRIDHGVNSLESDELCATIAERGIGLTVCPVSNRFVVQDLTGNEIRTMLQKGMFATINSDDPAYFRAYLSDNLQALVDDAGFTNTEIVTLVRNSFLACWLPDYIKRPYLQRIDQIAERYL
ncbi:MAG: adenosine deaminase [Pseudomonadota bacterium]